MNALNQVGQPSSLTHSLRRDSVFITASLKNELAYVRQNGNVRFGRNPALVFSGRLPTMPNGECRK